MKIVSTGMRSDNRPISGRPSATGFTALSDLVGHVRERHR
jgi:hypothetical protein